MTRPTRNLFFSRTGDYASARWQNDSKAQRIFGYTINEDLNSDVSRTANLVRSIYAYFHR